MKEITYIEFEPGDPRPDWLTDVIDSDNDTWKPVGDVMHCVSDAADDRPWENLLRVLAPIRTSKPSDDALRAAAQKLRDQAAELIARADALFPAEPAEPKRVPRVWTDSETDPAEPEVGTKAKDVDGSIWTRHVDGWRMDGASGDYAWSFVLGYVSLTEVIE